MHPGGRNRFPPLRSENFGHGASGDGKGLPVILTKGRRLAHSAGNHPCLCPAFW